MMETNLGEFVVSRAPRLRPAPRRGFWWHVRLGLAFVVGSAALTLILGGVLLYGLLP